MKNPKDTLRKNLPELLALCTGGLPGFLFRRHPKQPLPGIPVFCDHVVAPHAYEARLRFLRDNGYQTLTADELADRLNGITPCSGREIVLTVDDGPVQFYRELFPLLCAYGCKAVLFVCPGLHEETANPDYPTDRLCTWAELMEMQNSGHVDVQCHTLQHRSIPEWPRLLPLTGVHPAALPACRATIPANVESDLRDARHLLEQRLQHSVTHLAWPQYVGTEEARDIARTLGYRYFWTGTQTGQAWNRPGNATDSLVRLSGEFIPRLPGNNRESLRTILSRRYRKALSV